VRAESDAFPLVSVAIPAYKAEPFIEETIRSIAAQQYRPIEVVVVEDRSPDRTAEIVAGLVEEMAGEDIELRLLRQPVNMGGAAALRRGFEESRGEYVCWLSADDAFTDPKKTELEIRALRATGGGLSFCRRFLAGPTIAEARAEEGHWSHRFPVFDGLFDVWPRWRLLGLLFMNAINGSSVMVSRLTVQESGSFDSSLGNVDQDGDLWLRYSALGIRFAPVESEGVFYRLHPGQVTHQTDAVYNGCASNRLRMILALEEAGILGSVLRRGWPVLLLVNRGAYRLWPEVGQYLCVAGTESKPGFPSAMLLSAMRRRLENEGLWNDEKTGELVSAARTSMASDEFQRFVGMLADGRL
jgi:glycosyltransferase involved in cell wall biosynthesis